MVILLLAYAYYISLGQDELWCRSGWFHLLLWPSLPCSGRYLLARRNRLGATVGLIAGFWRAYTLPFPSLVQAGHYYVHLN